MREFKKRRSQRDEKLLFTIKCIGVLVLVMLTFGLIRATWRMYAKMTASSRAQEEAQAQLSQAEAQRSGVDTTLSEITSDRGVEQQIRQRYGVVRPGEGEIDIIRHPTASTTGEMHKETWWQRLFHALFVW